jgi:hypothetical protein
MSTAHATLPSPKQTEENIIPSELKNKTILRRFCFKWLEYI